jgi:hypothetical protein
MKSRNFSFPNLIMLLALLLGLSGCGYSDLAWNPFDEPGNSAPKKPTAVKPTAVKTATPVPTVGNPQAGNPQPSTATQPQPVPDPSPEWQAPLATSPISVWFEETDCALPDISGVEPAYGPGVLECNYRWEGKYIDDNHALIEIYELPDAADLARQFDEGVGNTHTSADSKSSDEMQSIIQNDDHGFIFIDTFPGGGSSKTHTEIPLCGRGGGYFKVNDRFLVHLSLFSCDISDTAVNYVRTLEGMQATALAAIARAQSTAQP